MESYRGDIKTIIKEFETDAQRGLSRDQVKDRLKRDGLNELPEGDRESLFITFVNQFKSPLIYILLFAALINFFLGEERRDSFLISGVLFFNAIIGTIQEGRARNILQSLRRFVKTKTVVVRDGEPELVDDAGLVVGDLIVLRSGERVPADARIIESNNLQIDESSLTGESFTVRKTTEAIDHDVSVVERNNMVFQGTYIIAGTGKAIVTATGLLTQLGKIHRALKEIDTEIPLKKEINRFSFFILIFTFIICLLLFGVGMMTGKPAHELLGALTALFVCVIPEGLPVVLTLVLVTGAYQMAKRFVLVKKMQAIDTLGRTDVIIIDKTGTLTKNEMMVSTAIVDGQWWHVSGEGYAAQGQVRFDSIDGSSLDKNASLMRMGIAASLLNSADIIYLPHLNIFEITGDQTEAALFIFSKKLGLDRDVLKKEYELIYEIPFDPQLRYHAGFFRHEGTIIAMMIGAPEAVLKHSAASQQDKKALDELLSQGLRVVAFAYKQFDPTEFHVPNNPDQDERTIIHYFIEAVAADCIFLGFCGIQDTIRSGLSEIIDKVRDAGIRVVVATGDHEKTAIHVAKSVSIFKQDDMAASGETLHLIADESLCEKLHHITVFSRVSPADKVRIVKLFRDCGYVVAMVGDGMNDAPAMAAADLGIAMGGIGASVAKQAADIVLLDDSFVNINNAIELGRHTLHTLRRVILYFAATNLGEIVVVVMALLANLPLPIMAAQILWLNLVTDGFLDVSLAMEPQAGGLMRSSWLEKKTRLVDSTLIAKMFFMGVPMGIGSFLVFWWFHDGDLAYARTMTLMVLAFYQWFNAWNCRSESKSIFSLGFFANKWLLLATTFVLLLQFFLLYTPFMRTLFKTVPLSAGDWLLVVGVTLPIVVLEELRKWLVVQPRIKTALTNLQEKLRYTK